MRRATSDASRGRKSRTAMSASRRSRSSARLSATISGRRPGCAERSAASPGMRRNVAVPSGAVMRTSPSTRSSLPAICRSAARISASARSARGSRASAAAEGSRPPGVRVKSRAPSLPSSAAMRRPTVVASTPSRRAAPACVARRYTARKMRRSSQVAIGLHHRMPGLRRWAVPQRAGPGHHGDRAVVHRASLRRARRGTPITHDEKGTDMNDSNLDGALDDQQKAVVAMARKFAMEVLRPAGARLDRLAPEQVASRDSVIWDVYRRYHELGFHKMILPRALGGLELDPLSWTLTVEQLAYGDPGLCESLACSIVPFLLTSALGGAGMQRYVREYCDDATGRMVGCFAFTEPDHGSDWVLAGQPGMDDARFAPSVRAVRTGKEYLITGEKSAFISNGPIASHALLILNVETSRGMQGTGIAFLPLDLRGISRGRPLA